MKTIKLNNGFLALVDDDDYEHLSQFKWFYGKKGYVDRRVGGRVNGKDRRKRVYMHRVVNKTPDGFETDHINRNKLDNQKHNLSTVTTRQNAYNQPRKTSTGFQGVSLNYGRYRAQISINGKPTHIGAFSTPEEAFEAYKAKAIELRGEFACFDVFRV